MQENTSLNTPRAYSLSTRQKVLVEIFELLEMLAAVTIVVMLTFIFLARVNIVDGHSMDKTLAHMEYLLVSDLFYEPKTGDIVVIHDITAAPYDEPIVKRIIATEGQTVTIDFSSWTLWVDDVLVEEPYRYLDSTLPTLKAEYNMDTATVFTVTVPAGEIFVMGDNRNGSADSRQSELGTIDVRCVVGKAYVRLLPVSKFGLL